MRVSGLVPIVAVAIVFVPSVVRGAVLTESKQGSSSPGNTTYFPMPAFPSSLGTLTGVQLSISSSEEVDNFTVGTLNSHLPNGCTVTVSDLAGASVAWTLPGGHTLSPSNAANAIKLASMQAFVQNVGDTATFSFPNQNSAIGDTITDPNDLFYAEDASRPDNPTIDLYVNTGIHNGANDFYPHVTFSGDTPSFFANNVQPVYKDAMWNVGVTYTYMPVPEPAAITFIGAVALVFARRRVK